MKLKRVGREKTDEYDSILTITTNCRVIAAVDEELSRLRKTTRKFWMSCELICLQLRLQSIDGPTIFTRSRVD